MNDKAIEDLPSLCKIIGYTYNVPSCIASPFFEYKDYEDWMELKGNYQNIPDTFIPGFKRFSTGILWLVFFAILSVMYKPIFLVDESFCSKSLLQQSFQQFMTMNTIKYTYFMVFALNDGNLVSSGLAYDHQGKREGKSNFDRIKNINENIIDTNFYAKRIAVSWNMTISFWLKKYVYNRLVSNSDKRPGMFEFLMTFLISAFWHGFYPGYYLFFVYFGVFAYSSGEIKKYYSWYFMFLPQVIRRSMSVALTLVFTFYIVPVFAIYDIRDIFYYHNCQYWY